MDAKPQRPIRTFRVSDENAPALNSSNKTLHHRNKSTPALSTVGATVAMSKALGKRTAFGDVSNTAVARPAKDAGLVNGKPATKGQDKITTTAFTRPAQRPVVTAKPSLASSASLNNLDSAHKPAAVDRLQGNGRNIHTKRNTVFRDPSLQPVPEADQPVQDNESTAEKQQPKPARARATTTSTIPTVLPASRKEVSTAPVAVKAPESESIVQDSQIKDKDAIEIPNDQEEKETANNVPSAQNQDGAKSVTNPTLGNISGTLGDMPSDVIYDYPPDISDPPEEYWEEEYEEGYDDEGYVTARSQRSRGDNTTGNATVFLFPKYTREAKREMAMAKKVVESTQTIEDFGDECWDTSMVAEYGNEIFQYMRELERRLLPNPHYMDNQAEIQWSMRSVLMDWLVQVHLRFALLPETLFLCVNYIDRFLSCKIVSLGKLQLVGATAIFVAAKYEEINCPSVHEVVYMVDNGYTADEILKAERFMLSMLQFELGWPGPMSFLRRISKADDYDLETRTLSKYFLEVTVMDERFVGCPPSFVAAGAHCLSRMLLRKGNWTPEHVHYSNYTYSQLYPLVSLILECCDVPQKHHAAVYEKYTDKRFKRASYFVETEIARGFKVPDVYREGSAARMASMLENYPPMKRF